MKKKKLILKGLKSIGKIEKALIFFLLVGLIVLNVILFYSISAIQGDARIVNYTGVVRGASQKLVKEELTGHADDSLIRQLTFIIRELREGTGSGEYRLNCFDDTDYQKKLDLLQAEWVGLEEEIRATRQTGRSEALYLKSQTFFDKANEVVLKAQTLAEAKVGKVMALRYLLRAFTLCFFLIFCHQLIEMIQLRMQNKLLAQQASVDPMTGLSNRWACDQKIHYYKGLRVLPHLLCVSIDLNNLKTFNDTYGHAVGDQLITSFGRILGMVITPHGFVGRNGGDEFLAFVEDCTREKEEAILKELREQCEIRNEKEEIVKISFAYGSALSSEMPDLSIFELIQLSDERMYLDKRHSEQGRDEREKKA